MVCQTADESVQALSLSVYYVRPKIYKGTGTCMSHNRHTSSD